MLAGARDAGQTMDSGRVLIARLTSLAALPFQNPITMNSTAWLHYYQQNRLNRPEPQWDLPLN
jgi:hypothetical protein